MLEVGQIVRHDGKIWRVGLVNVSRARLDPVSGSTHQMLAKTFTTFGNSINVSSTSPLDELMLIDLNEEERGRLRRLELTARNEQTEEEGESGMATVKAAKPLPAPVKVSAPAPVAKVKAAAPPTEPANGKVAAPISANKVANDQRKASLEAKEESTTKEPKPVKTKAVGPCKCGCGGETTANFVQGHDARFKSWLLKIERGEMTKDQLPDGVAEQYKWVKNPRVEGGMIPTTNYKGEPHTGYEKTVEA